MAIIRNFRLPVGIGLSADYIETFGAIGSTNPFTGAIVSRGGLGVSGDVYIGNNLSVANTIISGKWAGNAITSRYGGTGYTTYTKGDLLAGAGNTLVKFGVGTDNQILIANSSSGAGLSWATFANPTYGSFYSTQTQQVSGVGISTIIKFNNTYEANRVAIYGGSGTSSRIQIQDAGPYSITFSAMINLVSGTQPSKGDFWLRVNGQDVAQSNSQMSIPGKDYETLATVNFVYTFQTNDYFEIVMSSSDQHFTIEYLQNLTSPPRPNAPAIILSVLPITHIVGASGSGISGILSLNGSNVSQQNFLTGQSGSDFNISTASGNHTFNIPIAGIGATGLLSSQAQSIGGLKTFSSGISITASTASTNTSTGALIVSGGVGIGGSLFATSIAADTGVFGLSLQRASGGSLGAIYSTGVTPSSSNYSFATDGTNLNLNSTNNVYLNISNTVKATLSTNNLNIGINVASTSTTTGAFTVTGGVGIGGSLYVGGASSLSGVSLNAGSIGATSSTNSTSTSTGALTVTGGAGIGQSVSIGGRLQMFNGANYTAFVSAASANTTYTLPPTSPATGTSVLQSTSAGVLSWVAMTASGGLATSGASDGTVQIKSGSSLGGTNSLFFDTNLLGLRVSGFPGGNTPSGTDAALKVEQTVGSFNGNVNGTLIAANASSGFNGDLINLQLNAVTKFKVSASGAIGMSSDIVTTGVLSAGDLTNSTSTTTGALKVSGGAGITGNLFAGGNVRVTSSTASTSTATGALTVQGGLGVSGQLSMVSAALGFTGVQVNPSIAFIGNTSSAPITLTVLTDNSLSWEGTSGQLFAIDNNLTTGDIFSVSDISGLPIINASAGQTVTINEFGGYTQIGGGTINSISTTTGSLVIAGGLGMSGNAFIGGTTTITNGTNSINTGSGALVVNGGFGITGNAFIGGTTTIINGTNSINTGSGALVVNGGLGLTGNANIGGTVRISNGLNSTSTTTGTLIVNGGLGLTGNAFIGGTTTISSTTNATSSTTGALVVSGGAGIAKTLYLGSNLLYSGSMFSGTGTYAKNLGAGDIALDNGTDDTPAVLFYWNNNKNFGLDTFYSGSGTTKFRITKELNESGGTELWSIDRNGLITRSAWAPGETINTAMYNYSDLGMASTTTISSTSYTTFATVTYTPKSSTSYLWIEFSCTYTVSGTTADDFWSNIEVAGSEIVNANQVWTGQVGGGTRSGVMFPLAARYTNTGTAGIAISVRSKRGTSDDNTTIYGNSASGFMRIQEIGR